MNKDEYAKSLTKMRKEIRTEMYKCVNKILTAIDPLLLDLKVRQQERNFNALHNKQKHS